MRIPRIYCPQPLSAATNITLASDASHHVKTVLRLKPGAELIIFNGQGKEYQAQIATSNKSSVVVTLTEENLRISESPLNIHLGQALLRGDKMDFALQKSVELGVNEITPILSEFVNVKLTNERLEKKLAHWQGVIIHACEQSGRLTIPVLNPMISLQQWLSQNPASLNLMLDPSGTTTLKQCLLEQQDVALTIGPEGGFSPAEIQAAQQSSNWHLLQFGPRILRTETAGLAVMAAIQALRGDC